MENHIKTSMLIVERTGMLYISKLVCLLQNNGYVVHIKTSMFFTEKRKKTGMLYVSKLVCLLQKNGKTAMLYILKLVCLLQ